MGGTDETRVCVYVCTCSDANVEGQISLTSTRAGVSGGVRVVLCRAPGECDAIGMAYDIVVIINLPHTRRRPWSLLVQTWRLIGPSRDEGARAVLRVFRTSRLVARAGFLPLARMGRTCLRCVSGAEW